jgi:hypothetical protein
MLHILRYLVLNLYMNLFLLVVIVQGLVPTIFHADK